MARKHPVVVIIDIALVVVATVYLVGLINAVDGLCAVYAVEHPESTACWLFGGNP